MNLKKWKRNVETLAEAHEAALTCALLGIALILILVALFGKPHHKAMACIYIVL